MRATPLRLLITKQPRGIVCRGDCNPGQSPGEVWLRRRETEHFLFVVNHDRAQAAVNYRTWTGALDLLVDHAPIPAGENLPAFAVRVLAHPPA